VTDEDLHSLTDDQLFEASWWGTCQNTYGEETKQLVYARYMGLDFTDQGGPGPEIDLGETSVLDVGGGPCSLLLKCRGGQRSVVDPCPFPIWVADRYAVAGVHWFHEPAEWFLPGAHRFDEIWIYNVLQHVVDPELVVRRSRERAATIRIFEWMNMAPHEGHPHELRRELLEKWLEEEGMTSYVNEGGAVGEAFWGIFPSAAASNVTDTER